MHSNMVVLGEGNNGFMCMEVHFASDYLGQIRVTMVVWTPNTDEELRFRLRGFTERNFHGLHAYRKIRRLWLYAGSVLIPRTSTS